MDLMAKSRGRPFPPGNTASQGRPPESRNKATRAVQELFSQNGVAVSKKCLLMAMNGDSTALRLCMERVLPARKSLPLQFKLPKMQSAAELPQAAQAILQAVAKGQLSPDEGAAVMALLETYRETLVTAEIAQRVEILEKDNR